jgi:hypothetical protein
MVPRDSPPGLKLSTLNLEDRSAPFRSDPNPFKPAISLQFIHFVFLEI